MPRAVRRRSRGSIGTGSTSLSQALRARSQMISESRRALPGGSTALLNVNHAAFATAGDAFFLLLQASGQDDVGVLRRLGKEEIDDAEEFQLARALRA